MTTANSEAAEESAALPLIEGLGVPHSAPTNPSAAVPPGTVGNLRALGISHAFERAAAGDFRREPLPPSVATAIQVHGTLVVNATLAGRGAIEADGLLADGHLGEFGVAVFTADCVPVLLAAPDIGGVAALHAGWRGSLAGIVLAGVAALRQRGADPLELRVAIGPSIGACCYEVSEEVVSRFVAGWGAGVAPRARHLDLGAVIGEQLRQLGVRSRNVERIAECTACTRDDGVFRYFSHRRDNSPARQLSWIKAAPSGGR